MFDFNKLEQGNPLLLARMFPISCSWIRGQSKGNSRQDIIQTESKNSETCFQLLHGDNQSQRGCGKLQRKIEIQLQMTRLDI